MDYTPIQISNPEFVDLTQGMLEMCYEIIITDDNVADPEERFTVQLMRDPGFTLANIILSPNESVIEIQDNDGKSLTSSLLRIYVELLYKQ